MLRRKMRNRQTYEIEYTAVFLHTVNFPPYRFLAKNIVLYIFMYNW